MSTKLDRSLRRILSDVSHLPLAAEDRKAVNEVAHSGAESLGLGDHPEKTGKEKKAENAKK